MITCLLGKPGAGKSYEAVRLACRAVEAGRHVLTNLPLKGDFWDEHKKVEKLHMHDDVRLVDGWLSKPEHWDELLTDKFKSGSGDAQKGALVVIDEVVRVFSPTRLRGPSEDVGKQRQWAARLQGSCENTISTHRHARLDIVFLGQTYRQLPEWLRPQVEEWIELHSHKSSGMPGYSWRKFDTWYGHRVAIDQGVRKYDKEVFGRYSSHALAEGVDEGDDQAHGFAVKKWWQRWEIWFCVIALGGLAYAVPVGYSMVSKALRGEIGSDSAESLKGWRPGDPGGPPEEVSAAGPVVAQPASAVQVVAPVGRVTSVLESGEGLAGMPGRSVSFDGRVGGWYYFGDGSVLSRADFVLRGYRIRVERPCLLMAEGGEGLMSFWRCVRPVAIVEGQQ